MRILEDKVIVIGGVGDGVGRSLAITATDHGAKVVLCARTSARLDAIVHQIEAKGGQAVAVACDMAAVEDCQKAANIAVERFGRIDGVAVIACMDPDRKSFDEAPSNFADWRLNVDFNLWATLQFVKACLEHMTSGGSVVLSGSTSSDLPDARVAAYAAAKAALASMVRSIAYEYSAKFGGGRCIRLNMISFGAIAGEPFHNWVGEIADIAGRTYEQQLKRISRNYPLGYIPTPDEYANGIVMLLSDLSKAFNGLNLHVNGGLFMKS
jgi:NAD(P)-dependent dehydrogenase (short-subunit alcohol dehydrogenase family)